MIYDIVVIGGGISGMTSLLAPLENNIKNILIIERESSLGGILNQCISNRYGKKIIGTDVTGPELVAIVESILKKHNIKTKLNTEVLNISDNKEIKYVNSEEGVQTIKAKSIILATGCREKFTGSISIALNRFTGIYTIGNTQKIVNLDGHLPGKSPVIVANSNWALSIVRRLAIEGANIKAVIINDENGFKLNEYYKEIMEEMNILVLFNSKVEEIYGERRIEGVKIYSEDVNKRSLIACDSLIISVAYYPEIDIIKNTTIDLKKENFAPCISNYETSVDGIFACGNLVYGTNALEHDDIDGLSAGKAVTEYLLKKRID